MALQTMFEYMNSPVTVPDMSGPIEEAQSGKLYETFIKKWEEGATLGTKLFTAQGKVEEEARKEFKKQQDAILDIGATAEGKDKATKAYAALQAQFPGDPDSMFKATSDLFTKSKKELQIGVAQGVIRPKYADSYLEYLSGRMPELGQNVIENREGQGSVLVSAIMSDTLNNDLKSNSTGFKDLIANATTVAGNLGISNYAVNQGLILGTANAAKDYFNNLDTSNMSPEEVDAAVKGFKNMLYELDTNYLFKNNSPSMSKAKEDALSLINTSISDFKDKYKQQAVDVINNYRNDLSDDINEKYNGKMPSYNFYKAMYGTNADVEMAKDIKAVKQNKIDRTYLNEYSKGTVSPLLEVLASKDAKVQASKKAIADIGIAFEAGDNNTVQKLATNSPREFKMYATQLVSNIFNNKGKDSYNSLQTFLSLDDGSYGTKMLKKSLPAGQYNEIKQIAQIAQTLKPVDAGLDAKGNKVTMPNITGAIEVINKANQQGRVITSSPSDPNNFSNIEKEATKYGQLYPEVKQYLVASVRGGVSIKDAIASPDFQNIKELQHVDKDTGIQIIAPNGWSSNTNKSFVLNTAMNTLKESPTFNSFYNDPVLRKRLFVTDLGHGDYRISTIGGLDIYESRNGEIFKINNRENFYNFIDQNSSKPIKGIKQYSQVVSKLSPEQSKGAFDMFNTSNYRISTMTEGNKLLGNKVVMANGIKTVGEYLKHKTGIDMTDQLMATAIMESSLGENISVFKTVVPNKGNGLMQITRSTYNDAKIITTIRQQKVLDAVNTYLKSAGGRDIRDLSYEQITRSPIYSTLYAALVYAHKEAIMGKTFNYSTPKQRLSNWGNIYYTKVNASDVERYNKEVESTY